MSQVEGKAYDKNDKLLYTISGSWLTHMVVTEVATGQKETVWEEPPLVADAYLQYYYTELAVRLN